MPSAFDMNKVLAKRCASTVQVARHSTHPTARKCTMRNLSDTSSLPSFPAWLAHAFRNQMEWYATSHERGCEVRLRSTASKVKLPENASRIRNPEHNFYIRLTAYKETCRPSEVQNLFQETRQRTLARIQCFHVAVCSRLAETSEGYT